LLRATTCNSIHGLYQENYGIKANVSKEYFLGRKRAKTWLPKLANYKLERHFAGQDTYYFQGNPAKSANYTLAMIDVDVQKKQGMGSPEGAVAFAEHLRKTYWPGLCWERSRSGKGLGCPIFVKKEGRSASEVNGMLRRLDRWLKQEAISFDIENVEVKGTLPVVAYERGEIKAVKYGQFARYPKTLSYDQLANAPVLSCTEWLLKDIPEPSVIRKVTGSQTGTLITDDDLAQLPKYEKLYQRMNRTPLRARARFIVTAHDFAIACTLLRWFKKHPNADGTLPTRRIRELWTALYKNNQVKRPWNDRRWKCIRDSLSEKGYIRWIDERYQPAGRGLKGIACKWRITDEFDEMLNKIHNRESSFIDTLVVEKGSGQWLLPRLYPIQRENDTRFWVDADKRIEKRFAA